MLNANRPNLWKADIQNSVDFYNRWFLQFAPQTYRSRRASATSSVAQAILDTQDLRDITPTALQTYPAALSVLRMCCCPPIARERLAGLAGVRLALVQTLESGKLPQRLPRPDLQ